MADNDPQVDKVGNYDWIVESSELISLLTAVLGDLSGYPSVCVLGCGTSTLSADLQQATKSVSASASASGSVSVCACAYGIYPLELISTHRTYCISTSRPSLQVVTSVDNDIHCLTHMTAQHASNPALSWAYCDLTETSGAAIDALQAKGPFDLLVDKVCLPRLL